MVRNLSLPLVYVANQSQQVSSYLLTNSLKQPLTIPRIRRVKCDEASPACKRCTSTGRKCDGYGPRPKPACPTHAEAAQKMLLPPRTSTILPLYRPLAADIPGDSMERLYFHRFRQVAEEALGIRHVHTGLFWKQIVPQYCHEVPAVRHAYIAVGAAYTHFHLAGGKPDASSAPSDVEQFVLQQYSLAMSRIPRDAKGTPVKRQYGITMMCCAAFFCLEMLRGEWDSAFAHLRNGLRMMADLPEDVADILHNPAKWSQGMDTSYVRVSYMIQLLTRWELSTGYLAKDFQPVLGLQTYRRRQLDQGVDDVARSVEQMQDIVDGFCQDVNAFAWESRDFGMGENDSSHQLRYYSLQRRAESIEDMLDNGEAWKIGSRDQVAFKTCLLNHRVAALTLDLSPVSDMSAYVDEEARIAEVVDVAAEIRNVCGADGTAENYGIDVGIVPTLHVALRHCHHQATRAALGGLIREWPQKESFWDGPALREWVA